MTAATNWFVYMILTSDQQVYTGITTDMVRRWREHATGKAGARYFRGRSPAELCYLEAGHTRSTASQREATIKALPAKAKRSLINEQRPNTEIHIAQYKLHSLTRSQYSLTEPDCGAQC